MESLEYFLLAFVYVIEKVTLWVGSLVQLKDVMSPNCKLSQDSIEPKPPPRVLSTKARTLSIEPSVLSTNPSALSTDPSALSTNPGVISQCTPHKRPTVILLVNIWPIVMRIHYDVKAHGKTIGTLHPLVFYSESVSHTDRIIGLN